MKNLLDSSSKISPLGKIILLLTAFVMLAGFMQLSEGSGYLGASLVMIGLIFAIVVVVYDG